MIKLSDFIAQKLKEHNIDKVYGLTGGAVVHIFDSIQRSKMDVTFMNHEQAAAFAAVGHSKLTNGYSCCIVTTGPGVTNAITGLAAAWLDSVPIIFISGQSRLNQTTNNHKNIRQIGTQQLNVLPLVSSMTKYCVMLDNPNNILYELEKCFHIAANGRKGPVWIDIPIDLQWAMVDEKKMPSYFESAEYLKEKNLTSLFDISNYDSKFQKLLSLIQTAKYPLVLLGNGVRLSDSIQEVKKIISTLNIPFVTTWLASDLFPYNDRLNIGRVGLAGQRGANIAIQNSDLLIILGSHLPIPVTGSNTDVFSKKSKKVIVDIDKDEIKLKKHLFDLVFDIDLKFFCKRFNELSIANKKTNFIVSQEWLMHLSKIKFYNFDHTQDLVNKSKSLLVNQYTFINHLSESLNDNDMLVVDGGGTNVYISFQGFKNRNQQRILLSTSLCSMGSGIPESIGVFKAKINGDVYCVVGDGSFYLNVQELKTIHENNIKVKIIIFNNGGYLSIRETQRDFLNENYIGTSKNDDTNIKKLVEAFGLKYFSLNNKKKLQQTVSGFIDDKNASVLEVFIDEKQKVLPTQYFKKVGNLFEVQSLENMAPPLDESILKSLMIIKNV
uniref:thiamine pyrophosphate-binding protein n=1 Tax=Bacteroidota TaxID=976 RepID=UPI004047759D